MSDKGCICCGKDKQVMFMHSKCCMAHWELIQKDDKLYLVCEECGAPSGVNVTKARK